MISLRIRKSLLVLGVALCLASAGTIAGPGDGMVVGATKLVDNGSDAERFDLVLVAEGYTEAESDLFAAHAQAFSDYFFGTPPFSFNCSAFNVWRLDVVSTQAGADDPVECTDGTGATADTFFDASFCADGAARRLLGVDDAAVIDALNANVPGWDQAVVIVNTDIYGGSGGSVAVSSVSGTWQRIAVHEIGHAAFGLADEYEYWLGCGEDLDRDVHPAVEPVEPNVTTVADRDLVKWAGSILAETPVPTTENADCTLCDGQPDPFPGQTVVGLYEGAHYYHCDSYRPVFHCMMRDFAPFCPVCTDRILATLEPFQPENTAPVCDADGPYLSECGGETTTVLLDGTASSDADCDILEYSWTGDFLEGTAEGSMPLVTFAGLGTFAINLEVSDGEAMSACGSELTIEDTMAPVITVEPVIAECASPDGTPVDLGDPVVDEVCDPEVDLVNDAPDLFPLGETVVNWTATDDSGNQGTAEQSVTVADTTPPVIIAPDAVTEECASPDGTPVELGEPVVEDVCDPDVVVTNDAPDLFPLGETVVTWTATDASGNASTATQLVTVVDTIPPELSFYVSPDLLWPPNHKMKTIMATITVSDICDADPDVFLVSVVSDEPDNGLGDGDTVNDIQGTEIGTDDREFQLRAERAGGGDGRVYTITYTAEDDSGNATSAEDHVEVPHDMGQGNDP